MIVYGLLETLYSEKNSGQTGLFSLMRVLYWICPLFVAVTNVCFDRETGGKSLLWILRRWYVDDNKMNLLSGCGGR